MSDSTRIMSRLLALAFFIVVGLGIYAYSAWSHLQTTRSSLVALQLDRDSWKTKFNDEQKDSTAQKTSLNQCTAQIQDLQAQVKTAQEQEQQMEEQAKHGRTRSHS